MTLTDTQSKIVARANKKDINGWHYLYVQGDPYEIGFQHGYLLTNEFRDAVRVYTHMTLELYGMDYSFFAKQLNCIKIRFLKNIWKKCVAWLMVLLQTV